MRADGVPGNLSDWNNGQTEQPGLGLEVGNDKEWQDFWKSPHSFPVLVFIK